MTARPCWPLAARFVLAALLAAPLAAQGPVIDEVSPAQGTLDTEVVLDGSFLADVRPRVWLEFPSLEPGKPVKRRMRLLAWSETQVTALVLQAQLGPCEVVVKQPKGPAASAAFEIVPPSVGGFTPVSAGPGDEVVVSGAHFGSRRVRVRLFEGACKVLEWDDDSVTFKVPPSLPDGEWTPRVSNPLGEAICNAALVVSGSAAEPPVEFVKGLVGLQTFLAADTDVVAANLGAKLAFDAYAAPEGEQQQLSVLIPFALSSTKVPKLFSGTTAGSEPVFWQQTLTSEAPPVKSVYAVKPDTLPWKVHVLGRSQGAVFGLLEATMGKLSGPGPDTLLFEDGMFFVRP